MTAADRVGPLHGHHLDTHDPDHVDDCDQEDEAEPGVTGNAHWLETITGPVDCHCSLGADHDSAELTVRKRALLKASELYAGDTAEEIAAAQARVDRFMAGGNDA